MLDMVSEILDKHKSIFTEGLGIFKSGKVTLHIDPQVKPKFYKARTLPFSPKDKVEEELHRLESLGIITPIKHSQWAAPIVPVVKQNDTIRLCGDYRITVNQATKVDTYPLHKEEDLFSSSRIIRWTLTLSAYNFSIRHKAGQDLGNADALSRLPQAEITDKDYLPGDLVQLLNHLLATTTNASSIRRCTDTDPTLSQVRNFILQGWPTTQLDEKFQPYCRHKAELSVLEGCVVWGSKSCGPTTW